MADQARRPHAPTAPAAPPAPHTPTPAAPSRRAEGTARRPAAGSGLYAELHLHLGGAILPNVLHAFMQRSAHPLLRRYPTLERLERHLSRPRRSLDEYLRLHELVESLQRPAERALAYHVSRLVRGAYLFDNLAYMELRHCPLLRTDPALPMSARIDSMPRVVELIARAAAEQSGRFPLVFAQVLCMHSALPDEANAAILELAAAARPAVCAVDLAGPTGPYRARARAFERLFVRARSLGLPTTCHLYETPEGALPRLLPLLDRIGHGVQIPLRHPRLLSSVAKRGQCLEVCPTTYLRTGAMRDYAELRPLLRRCFDAGVDVAICTDNAGLHNVRLPHEYENLLVRDVITIEELARCMTAAFRHAFAWGAPPPPALGRLTAAAAHHHLSGR